jgi:hypothetical protein
MPKNFVVFAERYEHGAGDIGSLNATKKISLPSRIPHLHTHSSRTPSSRRFGSLRRRNVSPTPMLLIRSMHRITELYDVQGYELLT